MTATMAPKTPAGSVLRIVPVEIPEPYLDLIDGPYWAALTTVMPDGQPQTTPVWCNREGSYVLTNTMLGFRKEKNMRANPHVDLLVYDPQNPLRNIEVRGLVVEMTEEGAVEHDNLLAQLYTGKPGALFFGDAVPADFAKKYIPVKVTIAPTHVRAGDPTPSANLRARSGRPIEAEEATGALGPEPASELIPAHLPVPVPDSHRDLLVRPIHGILSTMKCDGSTPTGQPQASLVWVDYDGTYVLINTALGRQKCRNMQANSRVTLLVVDPNKTDRWVEVRGRVTEITTDGAIPHGDKLAQRYTGKQHFYGDVYEVEWQHYETRVIVKIEPVRVSLDAVFK